MLYWSHSISPGSNKGETYRVRRQAKKTLTLDEPMYGENKKTRLTDVNEGTELWRRVRGM